MGTILGTLIEVIPHFALLPPSGQRRHADFAKQSQRSISSGSMPATSRRPMITQGVSPSRPASHSQSIMLGRRAVRSSSVSRRSKPALRLAGAVHRCSRWKCARPPRRRMLSIVCPDSFRGWRAQHTAASIRLLSAPRLSQPKTVLTERDAQARHQPSTARPSPHPSTTPQSHRGRSPPAPRHRAPCA